MDDNKTDFLIKLGGKPELKKALNELVKEHELLRIKIEELVCLAIDMQYGENLENIWPTMKILHQMAGQHRIIFDSDCEKSPYGMHGKANTHILETCIWCHCEFED